MLHMPVVPIIETGHIEIQISAYSFLRIDTEVISIDIAVSGYYIPQAFSLNVALGDDKGEHVNS